MFEHAAGKTIPALDNFTTLVFTCSTGGVASGADINGKVIDRLGLVVPVAGAVALGPRDKCLSAEPWIFGQMPGSTSSAKNFSLSVRMQHGDSSGGGDMVDLPKAGGTTGVPATYFNSAMTTDMVNWTTGTFALGSNPISFELTGAKRFIRAVGNLTKFGVSTSTGTDGTPVVMGIRFGEFTYAQPTSVSTSSSTSTS